MYDTDSVSSTERNGVKEKKKDGRYFQPHSHRHRIEGYHNGNHFIDRTVGIIQPLLKNKEDKKSTIHGKGFRFFLHSPSAGLKMEEKKGKYP